MKMVPYASTVGSLQYAQACTRPDLVLLPGYLADSRVMQDQNIENW